MRREGAGWWGTFGVGRNLLDRTGRRDRAKSGEWHSEEAEGCSEGKRKGMPFAMRGAEKAP